MPFCANKNYQMILNKINILLKFFLTTLLLVTFLNTVKAEEESQDLKDIFKKIDTITKDLKTLETAFYKTSEIKPSSVSTDGLNEDILTRHLLKLNEIEEQFREITNRYEEINFKIDPFRKKCLLEGLDDIALTLKKEEKIDSFENKIHQKNPWII